METQWKHALEQGKKVGVDIKPIYSGNSKRPDGFEVSYAIDGIQTKLPPVRNTSTGE